MTSQESIFSLLELFIEEDDGKALEEALSLVKNAKFDINRLLQALDNIKGDLPRKKRAIMLVRRELGLSIIPGPVCRNSP